MLVIFYIARIFTLRDFYIARKQPIYKYFPVIYGFCTYELLEILCVQVLVLYRFVCAS